MVKTDWPSAQTWRSSLEILSLDFVRPIYGELGVRLPLEETIRGMVRDALTGRYLEAGPAAPLLGDPPNFYTSQVTPVLGVLERAFGVLAARRLEYWVRYTSCTENFNPWALYEGLFSVWASVFRKTGKDQFGLIVDPATVETNFRSGGDLAGPVEALNRQRKRLLSDWDFPLFSRRGLLEIPEGSDFFPFVDDILLVIAMARFQEFWKWLLSFVSAADLQAITTAARQRAESHNLYFCPPESLPPPI